MKITCHLCYRKHQYFIPFNCQLIFYFIDVTFIYPFISWWTLGFFPLFGCYKHCCYEYICVFAWNYIFFISLRYIVTPIFWETDIIFLLAMHESSNFFHICRHLLLSVFLMLATLMGAKWNLNVVSICTSRMTYDVEKLFMFLLAICISSSEKCLFRPFVHFLIGLFYCWLLSNFKTYSGYKSLIGYIICNMMCFLSFCRFYFHFLDGFATQMFIILM